MNITVKPSHENENNIPLVTSTSGEVSSRWKCSRCSAEHIGVRTMMSIKVLLTCHSCAGRNPNAEHDKSTYRYDELRLPIRSAMTIHGRGRLSNNPIKNPGINSWRNCEGQAWTRLFCHYLMSFFHSGTPHPIQFANWFWDLKERMSSRQNKQN